MILACSIVDTAAEQTAVHLLLHLYPKNIPLRIPADQIEDGLLAVDRLGRLLTVAVLNNVTHTHIVGKHCIEQAYEQRFVRRIGIYRLEARIGKQVDEYGRFAL